jgi:hypothetical protein
METILDEIIDTMDQLGLKKNAFLGFWYHVPLESADVRDPPRQLTSSWARLVKR